MGPEMATQGVSWLPNWLPNRSSHMVSLGSRGGRFPAFRIFQPDSDKRRHDSLGMSAPSMIDSSISDFHQSCLGLELEMEGTSPNANITICLV